MTDNLKIIYTETDEAPRLATYSFLPIIKAFTDTAGVDVEMWDISLAGQNFGSFSDRLPEDQKVPDHLAELGRLTQAKEANIIKLPNISASNPQMQATIEELRAQGYALPDYVDDPQTDDERENKARYDRVKGSAVNPVLREGNSDRRAARAVKDYAQKHPHRMGVWSPDSKSSVRHMESGDFYGSEQSVTMGEADSLDIVFTNNAGQSTVLASSLSVDAGEVVDAAFMSQQALTAFLDETLAEAKTSGVLWSLHLKATMMKVSDPILFGHGVKGLLPVRV